MSLSNPRETLPKPLELRFLMRCARICERPCSQYIIFWFIRRRIRPSEFHFSPKFPRGKIVHSAGQQQKSTRSNPFSSAFISTHTQSHTHVIRLSKPTHILHLSIPSHTFFARPHPHILRLSPHTHILRLSTHFLRLSTHIFLLSTHTNTHTLYSPVHTHFSAVHTHFLRLSTHFISTR